jgi:cytochrome c
VFAFSLNGDGSLRRNKSGRAAVLSPNTHEDNSMTRTTPIVNRLLVCALLAAANVAAATLALADDTAPADAAHGKTLYQGCQACHSIDDNDLGPRHRGVVGRRAGSLQDYSYSAALKNSGLTWDEPTLDRWLTNPSALVPGTKMFFRIDDAQARADIIAYLKELK